MSKLIDVKHFAETLAKCGGDVEQNATLFAMLCLANTEAELFPVDAVHVIRCKDCVYWQDNQEGHYPHPDCKWNKEETPDADDYCSGAERRPKND